MEAGEKDKDGNYPQGTVNFLVNKKLQSLAEELRNFGEDKDKKKK
jgi:hypothetical protein